MPINWDFIIVKAALRFRTTAEGGRTDPVKSGYRPNHVFERDLQDKPQQTFIGDVILEDGGWMELGEAKTVTIRFLRVRSVEQYITVGRKWLLYEVPRIVGEEEILEILEA
jgi:hypothetical protein